MNLPAPRAPFITSIFHPSDFSKASELAFAHALAIALIRQAELVIMHAGGGHLDDWSQFPHVRETLERWQILPPGSPRSAVFDKLAVKIVKISAPGDPVEASVEHIEKRQPDLIVLATRGHHGLPQWLKPSIAQAIARRTEAMTLFVPRDCRGIVSLDGVITLRRILIPIDRYPNPQEGLVRAVRVVEAFADSPVEIILLHVGDGEFPQYERPESELCTWQELHRQGDPAAAILEAAQEQVDLIIMATEGRLGFVDAIRGSVTEQVVYGAGCPVLAVPSR